MVEASSRTDHDPAGIPPDHASLGRDLRRSHRLRGIFRRLRHGDVAFVGPVTETPDSREALARDVVIVGSGSLVGLFVDAGAVDEYRLRVFPTATGASRRLFREEVRLDLAGTERMGPTVLTIYMPGA
ncbi:MAG: dihydrofolate reductase family protein [Actinobacteria bacterium]|nr:dihydrofolate reductase family protein [Actinomycetota bacterium]